MMTALIVEPDPELRENTSEILELHGWKTVQARDKMGGIKAIIDHEPDIILCDAISPLTESSDILHFARIHLPHLHVPVLFFAEENKPSSAWSTQPDQLLPIPFTAEELMSAIDESQFMVKA